MKQAIKEAIEFLQEFGNFNLSLSASEGYISLAEAVSEVLDNLSLIHI